MISLIISVIAVGWLLSALYFVKHVAIPLLLMWIDDRRWAKLHPGMPSWRRVR